MCSSAVKAEGIRRKATAKATAKRKHIRRKELPPKEQDTSDAVVDSCKARDPRLCQTVVAQEKRNSLDRKGNYAERIVYRYTVEA